MSGEPDLYDLIRQLKTELEWASRTGIVVEARPAPPPEPEVRIAAPPPPPPRVPPPPASRPQSLQSAYSPHGGAPVLEVDLAEQQRTEHALVQIGARPSLAAIRDVLGACTRCKLHRQGRTQIVFGVGSATAELMFVGEGPGADEDRQGEPFVGKAGQLLTKIIEAGMGFRRAEVYIANIVKCRPPNNRDPEADEVAQCEPFLRAQIRSIGPKVIVTLGKHASQTLLRTSTPITRLRGRWSEYDGIPVMPTYHPAYLLRNPAEKRAVWEDVQEVLRKMGRPIPERGARD
jgi:DNA polymerase